MSRLVDTEALFIMEKSCAPEQKADHSTRDRFSLNKQGLRGCQMPLHCSIWCTLSFKLLQFYLRSKRVKCADRECVFFSRTSLVFNQSIDHLSAQFYKAHSGKDFFWRNIVSIKVSETQFKLCTGKLQPLYNILYGACIYS